MSEQFPTRGDRHAEKSFGHPVLANVTAQYFLLNYFWPELEINSIWWPDGSKGGRSQLYATPGIIFGRFPIREPVRLIFGVGYQASVASPAPGYRNNVSHSDLLSEVCTPTCVLRVIAQHQSTGAQVRQEVSAPPSSVPLAPRKTLSFSLQQNRLC